MQKWIGQKLILKTKSKKIPLGDRMVEIFAYKIFDPEKQSKLEALSHRVRYFLPGDIGSSDHQSDRINFYIDKNGVIYKIDHG